VVAFLLSVVKCFPDYVHSLTFHSLFVTSDSLLLLMSLGCQVVPLLLLIVSNISFATGIALACQSTFEIISHNCDTPTITAV
jgi:hypothetical protein